MSCKTWLVGAVVLIALAGGGQFVGQASDHSWSEQKTYVSNSRTTSKFIANDFVPDGNLNKPLWRGATWVTVEHDAFKPVTYTQSVTKIASLWTAKYVYFAFRCKYTTLNVFEGKDPGRDFWTLWDRDVVEIFLNPQPEHMRHYYEFEVAPNNLWIDLEIDLNKKPFGNAQWNSGFQHATRVDAANHVWTCELRIPVAALMGTGPLKANTEWRINFFRADGQGGDTQRRLLSWSRVHNDTASFHAPWSFGVIQFVK